MCVPNSSVDPCLWWWWDDTAARSGAENMAVDEWLLLSNPARPVVRCYRWTDGGVSFGYAERFAPVAERFPGRPLVRRWSGGGVVDHAGDVTYTVVLPRASAPGWQNSTFVYARLHQFVAAALRKCGQDAICALSGGQQPGALRFTAPVWHDVLVPGQKVAGAGQRRTREGILHQGSLQGAAARPDVVRSLAVALGGGALPESLPDSCIPPADALQAITRRRYANPVWLEQRG